MSTIVFVYHPVEGVPTEPNFPATDQHPDAVRYLVGLYYVDATDGEPTAEDVAAFLRPPVKPVQDHLQAAINDLPADEQAAYTLLRDLLNRSKS